MAKKQKEKQKLIEDIVFEDFAKAERTVKFAKINLIRVIIGLVLAVIGTGLSLYGLFGNGDAMMGIYVAIPAYLIGGGIFKALKTAFKLAKIGWFIVPVFPADLAFALVFLIFGIVAFLFVPIVFVGLNYIQHNKTYQAAQEYLAGCARAENTVTE